MDDPINSIIAKSKEIEDIIWSNGCKLIVKYRLALNSTLAIFQWLLGNIQHFSRPFRVGEDYFIEKLKELVTEFNWKSKYSKIQIEIEEKGTTN